MTTNYVPVQPLDLGARKMHLSETIGRNIRRMMAVEDTSMTSLAKRCGMSTAAMARIVSGDAPPSMMQALSVCEVLDCSLDALVEGL